MVLRSKPRQALLILPLGKGSHETSAHQTDLGILGKMDTAERMAKGNVLSRFE